MWVKQRNAKLLSELLHGSERLAAIIMLLYMRRLNETVEGTERTRLKARLNELKDKFRDLTLKAWMTLLKNHPHDDITGCSVDEVYELVDRRYQEVEGLISRIRALATDFLSELFPGPSTLIFNPLPFEVITRSSTKLPAFSISSMEGSKKRATTPIRVKHKRDKGIMLSNELLELTLSKDNTLHITDKLKGQHYKLKIYFEDEADVGDEYDFSPPPPSSGISNAVKKSSLQYIELEEVNENIVTITLRHRLDITEPTELETKLTLTSGSPLIIFETSFINRFDDHRRRLVIEHDLEVRSVFSDSPFDIIPRRQTLEEVPSRSELLKRWRAEQLYWMDLGWLGAERPQRTFPLSSFVTVVSTERTLSLITEGLPECEVFDNTVKLTLLRSVGWLSRDDLQSRPGYNAGPPIPTPGAQCHGHHTFRYALLVGYLPEETFRYSQTFLSTFPILKVGEKHEGLASHNDLNIPLVELGEGKAVISSIRLPLVSSDASGKSLDLEIRLFNPYPHEVSEALLLDRSTFMNASVSKTRLDGKELKESGLNLNDVGDRLELKVKLRAKEIVTLRFELLKS